MCIGIVKGYYNGKLIVHFKDKLFLVPFQSVDTNSEIFFDTSKSQLILTNVKFYDNN